MKYEITVLILWLIAILTTYFVVAEPQIMTRLAPLYFICMVGNLVTVRRASRHAQRE